jgi:hypothetical protein
MVTDPLNIVQNGNTKIGRLLPDVNGTTHPLIPSSFSFTVNGHSMDNVLKEFGIDPSLYNPPFYWPVPQYDPNK